MIKVIKTAESFLKSVAGIIIALGSILTALMFIYSGIIKLNNTVASLAKTIPLVEEHTLFVNQEIDYTIDECLNMIANREQVPRRMISKLLVYRETLKKSLTYKQKMNIDYIERKTNYK